MNRCPVCHARVGTAHYPDCPYGEGLKPEPPCWRDAREDKAERERERKRP